MKKNKFISTIIIFAIIGFSIVKYSTLHTHFTDDGKFITHSHFYLGSNSSEETNAKNNHRHDQNEYTFLYMFTIILAGILFHYFYFGSRSNRISYFKLYNSDITSNTTIFNYSLRAPPIV
ncbi:MAG: hypothetical protein JEY94_16655 [Melioribacteraceae bacterium]|nr:hypothetical protein [Melioribacteraceae bacterium]